MQAVYFGGSRHPQNINPSQVAAVVASVVASGQAVHVGCQFGADQAVIKSAGVQQAGTTRPLLSVFAVAPTLATSPAHVQWAETAGAQITLAAGGKSAPMPARYLLRSIAAFQGCKCAVFFSPGSGSLAVARECVKSGLPVFAFQGTRPALIPSCAGHWVGASFMGFECWQWLAPSQPSLF